MAARFEDDEAALLREAAAWPEQPTLAELTRDDLLALTTRRGIDFATAVLYDRLQRLPQHGPLIRSTADLAMLPSPSLVEAKIPWVIVPGAFHCEHPETGADGAALRAQAARLGIPCEVIPTESFGSLAVNCTIVQQFLERRDGEPCLLISLSKGTLEVRRLLERPDAESLFQPVRAWISLSGLLCGSPVVSWLLRRPLRTYGVRAALWWRGYDFRVVRELDRTAELVNAYPRLPAGLTAFHVVGFPLQRHLSSALLRRGHRRLAEQGPNDGAGAILADVLAWPGVVYPVWGADHYLRTPYDDLSTLTLRVLHDLDRRAAAVAPQPLTV